MSDEEKEAVGKLETLIQYLSVWNENFTIVPADMKYLVPIFNLITKQSKEIEELKDTRSVFNMGRRSYKNEIEDKIKAKIEEIDMTGEIGYLVKGILQSLLEKE